MASPIWSTPFDSIVFPAGKWDETGHINGRARLKQHHSTVKSCFQNLVPSAEVDESGEGFELPSALEMMYHTPAEKRIAGRKQKLFFLFHIIFFCIYFFI